MVAIMKNSTQSLDVSAHPNILKSLQMAGKRMLRRGLAYRVKVAEELWRQKSEREDAFIWQEIQRLIQIQIFENEGGKIKNNNNL